MNPVSSRETIKGHKADYSPMYYGITDDGFIYIRNTNDNNLTISQDTIKVVDVLSKYSFIRKTTN